MVEMLKRTLQLLEGLNDAKSMFSESELAEQKENVEDFESRMEQLKETLEKLEKDDLSSVNRTVELLIDLHLVFDKIIHIAEEMHGAVKHAAGHCR